MSDKKKMQLGMNPSTASGRLVKDLLWNFVETTGQMACCKCGEPMSRETFSIEHVTPWLDSDDPVGLYFEIENISYSHLRCNVEAARKTLVETPCGTRGAYRKGCKCSLCVEAQTGYNRGLYTKESRHQRYKRTGN